MAFDGFPRNVMLTPVPAPMFNILLEEIEDVVELKLILRIIWLLDQKKDVVRTLGLNELLDDSTLLRAARLAGDNPRQRINQALEGAVKRGVLLRYESNRDNRQPLYVLNTAKGRNDLRRLKGGSHIDRNQVSLGSDWGDDGMMLPPEARPNIFALYEDNIGTIGPVIAEELKEAEEQYPARWISEAFRIALVENKRSWRYVAGILRRWASEGRSEESSTLGENLGASEGSYYGESGRYTSTNKNPRVHRRR